MSLELQDLIRLSGEHRDSDKKFVVLTYSIPSEVKTKTFHLDSPISYIFIVDFFENQEEALKKIIEYVNRYPYLRFELVLTNKLEGLGGKKKELNLGAELWKNAKPVDLLELSEQKLKEEEIRRQVQQEKSLQDDEDSLEFFRYNFFNVCQNKEAIDLKRKDLIELENKTLERINKCLKFVFKYPHAFEDLKKLYRERLDTRGETRIADYLISKLNDLDGKGIPKVLSPSLK